MPTHSRFALFLPALALVGCTQSMPGEPGDPTDPSTPSSPQQPSNLPALRYAQPLVYSEGVDSPRIADLDGDGHLDMLVQASSWADDLRALYNHGDGSFSPVDAGHLYLGLIADLNGDGLADPVGWSSLITGNLSVAIAQPGKAYSFVESPLSLPFDLTYGAQLAAADLDGDGRPEIVATLPGATYAMSIDGSGHVVSTEALSSTTGLSVAPDLDGDHRAELCAIKGASVSITSSRNGTVWATAISDCTVKAVRFVDLDGDGTLDLVAAADDRSSGALHVVTFQSNGDGSFTRRADNVVGPNATFDDVVDVDGDGHPDVAFRNGVDASEYFAVGDGAFGFKSSSYAVPLPDPNGNIQFAELNGDGRPDIVLAVGGSIYVLDSM